MLKTLFSLRLPVALICATFSAHAHASSQKVIYNFCVQEKCTDGAGPSGLVADAAGNLYGTTYYGGVGGPGAYGVAYELSPGTGGKWSQKVIHNFTDARGQGIHPSAGLTFDAKGSLYGTTVWGGIYNSEGGTVFELTPSGDGSWTETILHSFCSESKCRDGQQPSGGVIFDAAGNLYGMTAQGGSHSNSDVCPAGCGTVFELSPGGDGTWTESVFYNFCSEEECTDGAFPNSNLIFDANGNLYGVTEAGGTTEPACKYGCGTVFELTPGANGKWSETILHRFNYTTGALPLCTPAFDHSGNLYCTTKLGGPYQYGVAFQLQATGNGGWEYKVIHDFGKGDDGQYPQSGLALDAQEDLYGTTSQGGSDGYGTVFKLTSTGGEWVEKILHNFDVTDGAFPNALLPEPDGTLYGTAGGGASTVCGGGCGTVFELTP
jgi:uncharacterized repeat protein (TIGR03803 family)